MAHGVMSGLGFIPLPVERSIIEANTPSMLEGSPRVQSPPEARWVSILVFVLGGAGCHSCCSLIDADFLFILAPT